MNYFISLIVLLLPSYLIRFSVFGIPTTLLEILIYLSAVLTLIKFLNESQFSIFKQNKILIPIVLFIIAGIISIFVAPDKREALGLFKAYIFDPILLFFVLVMNIKDNKDKELILKSLILSGFIVSLHAIWQKFTGHVTFDDRVVGIFGYSPNYLALYLAPILVLLFGYEDSLLKKKHSFKEILSWDLVFAAILLALYFTGSRAAFGATIIGIIFYFIIRNWNYVAKNVIAKWIIGFLIVGLLFLSWQIVKPDWQASGDSGRISSSNNIRWEIWKTTIKDIIPVNSHWLVGVGLGNYQNYFTELTKNRVNFPEWISPWALTPHNVFLNIWINLGLLGLVSFIWFIYIFFKSKRNNNYTIIVFSVMFALLIQGMVDSPYWKNDLAIMFWVLIFLSLFDDLNDNTV